MHVYIYIHIYIMPYFYLSNRFVQPYALVLTYSIDVVAARSNGHSVYAKCLAFLSYLSRYTQHILKVGHANNHLLPRGPFLWHGFILLWAQVITPITKCGMKLLIHAGYSLFRLVKGPAPDDTINVTYKSSVCLYFCIESGKVDNPFHWLSF